MTTFPADEYGATAIECAPIPLLARVGVFGGGDILGLCVEDVVSSDSSDLQAVTLESTDWTEL